MPEYKWLQETAVKRGWSQDEVTELVGKYAEVAVGRDATFQTAAKAELDKLGANATARITAIETWLGGVFGPELAKTMRSAMYGAKIVEGFETIVSKFATQGHASFTQSGRVPQSAPGRVSDAEYAAMTPAQRWDYAKSFDQKQFQNGPAR